MKYVLILIRTTSSLISARANNSILVTVVAEKSILTLRWTGKRKKE